MLEEAFVYPLASRQTRSRAANLNDVATGATRCTRSIKPGSPSLVFRADLVGSYLRPPELIEARTALQQGELTRENRQSGWRATKFTNASAKPRGYCRCSR